jgi:sulfite exporter TauE/SafE
VTAFALGAVGAAAALGAVCGALGGLVVPAGVSARTRLAVLALALAAALVLDVRRPAALGPRRQVNERWLDEFRGWIYGAGFGAQLGLGVTTIVASAATYAALLAAIESGSPASGALILGAFGAVRGLTPLVAARVRTPAQLLRLHRRFAAWQRPTRGAAVAALAVASCAALVGSLA